MSLAELMARLRDVLEEALPNTNTSDYLQQVIEEILVDSLVESQVTGEDIIYLVIGDSEHGSAVGFVDASDLYDEKPSNIEIGKPKIRGGVLLCYLDDWLHENGVELLKWKDKGEASPKLREALNVLRDRVC